MSSSILPCVNLGIFSRICFNFSPIRAGASSPRCFALVFFAFDFLPLFLEFDLSPFLADLISLKFV